MHAKHNLNTPIKVPTIDAELARKIKKRQSIYSPLVVNEILTKNSLMFSDRSTNADMSNHHLFSNLSLNMSQNDHEIYSRDYKNLNMSMDTLG